jgi:hypothetical protein
MASLGRVIGFWHADTGGKRRRVSALHMGLDFEIGDANRSIFEFESRGVPVINDPRLAGP